MLKARTRVSFLAVALLVNLVLASTVNARGAYACTCAVVGSLEDEVKRSDAVFSGTVTGVEEDKSAPGGGPPLGRVNFDVNEPWKGVSEGSVFVYGQGPEEMCGLDFDPDENYLVYAYRTGDHLETGFCTATKPLANAREDLRVLGSPSSRLPETGGTEPALAPVPRAAAAVAVVASLALAGALVLRRRPHRGR